jgi:hypothetical protein
MQDDDAVQTESNSVESAHIRNLPIRHSETGLEIALEFTYVSQNRFIQFVPFTQAFYLC